MGPIEILYLTIGIIVVLIGVARGYVKELGSTLIILVALFILTFFKEPVDAALGATAQGAFGSEEGAGPELFLYHCLRIPAMGTSPSGGQRRKACCSACWSGIINGIGLIAGTLWYYQEAYGYPIPRRRRP